jgi:hypothetical protein
MIILKLSWLLLLKQSWEKMGSQLWKYNQLMNNIKKRECLNQHFIEYFLLTLLFLHDHEKEVSSYNKLKLQKKSKYNK